MLEINEDRVKKIDILNDINLSNLYHFSIFNNISLEYIDPRFEYFPKLTELYKNIEVLEKYDLDTFIRDFLLSNEKISNQLFTIITEDEEENVQKYIEWFSLIYEKSLDSYEHIKNVFLNEVDLLKHNLKTQYKIRFYNDKKLIEKINKKYDDSNTSKVSKKSYIEREENRFIENQISKSNLLKLFLHMEIKKNITINDQEIKVDLITALKILWTDITDINVIYRIIKSRKSINILLIGESHAEKLKNIFSDYNVFSSESNVKDFRRTRPQCIDISGFEFGKLL